ncbi:MAG: hypothetical protein ABI592_01400 [Acidobacteriota bacterium]
MADEIRPLRVVAPGEAAGAPPRGRRPGPAVLLVLAYGAVFGGGLWALRAWTRPAPPVPPGGASRQRRPGGPVQDRPDRPDPPDRPLLAPDRAALLSGEGIPEARRAAYLAKLSTEPCTCGCGSNVRECLERDRTCARSPEIARGLRSEFP